MASKENQIDIPSEFLCPITQDLMVDPVITADGNTYEKESIEKWFKLGHLTSPVSGAKLEHDKLVPNLTLKRAIAEFEQENDAVKKKFGAMRSKAESLQTMLEMKKKELDEMALAKKKMVSRDDFQRLLGMLNRARKSRLRYERINRELQEQVKALKSRKGSGGASFAATVEVGEGDPVDRLMSTRRRNIDNTIRSYQEIVQNSEIEKKKLKATKADLEASLDDYQNMSKKKAELAHKSRGVFSEKTEAIKKIKIEVEALAVKFRKAAEDMMGMSTDEADAKLDAVREDPSKAGKSAVLMKYAASCMELADAEQERKEATASASGADDAKHDADERIGNFERRIAKVSADMLALDAKITNAKEGIRRETAGIAKLKRSMQMAREAVEWMRELSENTFTPTVANLPDTIVRYKQSKMGSCERLRSEKLNCLTLLKNGITHMLVRDGFTVADMHKDGVPVKTLHDEGFGADVLKRGGYTAQASLAGGYSMKELKDGGWTAKELKAETFTATQLRSGGFDANALKQVGYTAQASLAGGYSIKELKDGGWTAKELKAERFTDGQLGLAGFNGYTATERKTAD
eukprot:g3560.t1